MRIAMIGTGYVGLVSGACFAEFGLEVVCVDKDAAKIAMLARGPDPDLRARPRRRWSSAPCRRPALLHHRPRRGGRAAPTRCSSPSARRPAAATAMPTSPTSSPPPRRSRPHLTQPTRGRHQVDRAGRHRPQAAADRSRERRPDLEIDVASNPEFLREGSAIEDFLRPDRVVIGAESRARARGAARSSTGRST